MVAGAGFELRVFFRNFIARFSISCLGIQHCSGLLKLDTQLSGNLPLERSVHYEEKTHV